MIAKHSAEQSHGGEGVEVVENRPHEDPKHGQGQYTEKRIHLSRWEVVLLQSEGATKTISYGAEESLGNV